MKEYLKKAIENGDAYDSTEHPEITEKLYEEGIGWMRNIFNDIDEVIQNGVGLWRREGVAYFEDVESTIYRFQMRNMSKYIKLTVEKFKNEMRETLKDEKVS